MATIVPGETIRNIRQSLHNLTQPLAVLTGLVDLLLLELDQGDPALPDVQQISIQLERVLQIVGDMHRLAREASLPVEPIRLEPLAQPKL